MSTSTSDNFYAFLAIVIIGPLLAAADAVRGALRLSGPPGARMRLRDAIARFARALPSRLLLVTLVLWALQAASHAARVLDLTREETERSWPLGNRDHEWELARSGHPDLPEVLRRIASETDERARIMLHHEAGRVWIEYAARYLLLPRYVTHVGDADLQAYIGSDRLPRIEQPSAQKWLALTPADHAGQTFTVPRPGATVMSIEVMTGGSVQPHESLRLLLYATPRMRRVLHQASARGESVFIFDAPVRLPPGPCYLDVSILGGGDGKLLVGAAEDRYDGGFALAPGAGAGTDLAFKILVAPTGYELLDRVGKDSYLFRKGAS